MFYEQKLFILYLIGKIPSFEDWTTQVQYKSEMEEIKNLSTIELSQADFDLANLQGRSISELKKERLQSEKRRRISELKKSYGIKEEEQEEPKPEGIPENNENRKQIRQEKLWELLQGKGLIKDGK